MADALASETKTSLDVFEFKIRMFPDDLFRTHAVGKQLQNVTHSHPHAADVDGPFGSRMCRAWSCVPGLHWTA